MEFNAKKCHVMLLVESDRRLTWEYKMRRRDKTDKVAYNFGILNYPQLVQHPAYSMDCLEDIINSVVDLFFTFSPSGYSIPPVITLFQYSALLLMCNL